MLPEMMKGMVLTGHGGLDRLQWREDLSVPLPAVGEVLIRVGASAVNNTDINTRIAWYSKRVRGDTESTSSCNVSVDAWNDGAWSGAALSFPRVQGADCCGEIVAVGEGVSEKRIGERVLVRALQSIRGVDGVVSTVTFGSERDGAFAEYTTAASGDALAITSSLGDAELASFPCAFSTAEGMLQRASVGAERVLITGASGGVGSAAIQLAKRRGVHVTAVTSAGKAEALRVLGADAILDRETVPEANAYDVVLDLVGGHAWPTLIDSLRQGGRYSVAGAIAGPIVELDLRTLYLRDLSFFGSTHQPDNIFPDLVGYIERGEIVPVLAKIYPVKELRQAQEAFLSKRHVGKIGISVC